MTTPRPVTIVSAERGPGPASVIYRVAKVGAFTLSPLSHYPAPDGESMRVTYGAAVHDPDEYYRIEVTERPRVNGVEIGGYSGVTTETALAHLAAVREDPARFTTWSVVRPYRHSDGGPSLGQVPCATRDRTAFIVATLIEDYFERADYFDMLRAYARSKARERLASEQRDIARLREEIATRQATLAEHVARASAQTWLMPPEDVTADMKRLREQAEIDAHESEEVMAVATG